eukprot:2091440-Lingulodinium_polyedra.AAC.1
MRSVWLPLLASLLSDVARGGRVFVLTGPPGAAKTDAGAMCVPTTFAFIGARVLVASRANRN